MTSSFNQLQKSRWARTVAFVAVASFVFLLRPYCDFVSSAHADAKSGSSGHENGIHGHGHPVAPSGTCPSLDHSPAVEADAIVPMLGGVTPPTDARSATGSNDLATSGFARVTPRATPPPGKQLPLYLRYAHLLT